jgi:hypothetical protein
MPASRRVDLVHRHQTEYIAPRNPRIVVAGKAQYLSIGGVGSPSGALFLTQVSAILGLAHALRRAKKKLGKDFRVCPLEAIWPKGIPSEAAGWKLLVRVPTFVQRRDLAPASVALEARGLSEMAATVELTQLKEGRCVQALHIGSCLTQSRTLERMRRAAREAGLSLHGQHHQIYLSDPRRVPPERMRTILRHPVKAAR